jgi:hypothetical protein
MEYTTIRISAQNRAALDDLHYEYKLDTPDLVLSQVLEDLARSRAVIADLTTRAQVNAEERDQALQLLHMTVPELHQAHAQAQASKARPTAKKTRK